MSRPRRHGRWRPLVWALVIELAWGELPNPVHPVVVMGDVLSWCERWALRALRTKRVVGLVVALALPTGWALLARRAERCLPAPLVAVLLSATFAGRTLLAAAERVEHSLLAEDVPAARQQLSWLVSRPTTNLSPALVASAAIESLAENFVDSWVAPLTFYSVAGLAGAAGYRAANTADAMWGYRTAEYEALGMGAARLDDFLSWVPARLGTALLVLASGAPGPALTAWWHDAKATASPNAGQSMAALAGALGVRLEKSGAYVLHAGGKTPGPLDIRRARELTRFAMLLAAVLTLFVCWLRDDG